MQADLTCTSNIAAVVTVAFGWSSPYTYLFGQLYITKLMLQEIVSNDLIIRTITTLAIYITFYALYM